jgi:hypothetical protein
MRVLKTLCGICLAIGAVVGLAEAQTLAGQTPQPMIQANPSAVPAQTGKAIGHGPTKADAHAQAAGRVPRGATTGQVQYFINGNGFACWIHWTKP